MTPRPAAAHINAGFLSGTQDRDPNEFLGRHADDVPWLKPDVPAGVAFNEQFAQWNQQAGTPPIVGLLEYAVDTGRSEYRGDS